MSLQSTLSPSKTPKYISSSHFYPSYSNGSPSFISFSYIKPHKFNNNHNNIMIRCSSKSYVNNSYLNKEKKPIIKWSNIFKRVSILEEDTPMGVADVLNQFENEGKVISKWELCRIVKELRKFRKYKLALQVYEWMNNRIERFRLSSSDTAIQLDLVAKVRGIPVAEDYFSRVPDTLKDKRIYGALLNAYVGVKLRGKAENLMDEMRSKGYAVHPLPFNVMMTLYMKLDEFDKAEELVSEMKQKRISLDSYTYNIWLSLRGSQNSAEGMEQVFEEMDLDPTIVPNWATFSTMASMYVKMGLHEKAEQCLKNLETRINGRDRVAYHYLISLYGSLGNREEVYRVWNIYKSVFPIIPNWGYHSAISSLVRSDDIEGAEKLYEEWLAVKSSYDPKIANLLMGWYVTREPFEKVKGFFDHMIEAGGKPNASSWEVLGEGHIKEGRISEALDCFKAAVLAEGAKNWRPKASNINAFLELCDQETNQASKAGFLALLTQMGCTLDEEIESKDLENENVEIESKDPEMLISVIE